MPHLKGRCMRWYNYRSSIKSSSFQCFLRLGTSDMVVKKKVHRDAAKLAGHLNYFPGCVGHVGEWAGELLLIPFVNSFPYPSLSLRNSLLLRNVSSYFHQRIIYTEFAQNRHQCFHFFTLGSKIKSETFAPARSFAKSAKHILKTQLET